MANIDYRLNTIRDTGSGFTTRSAISSAIKDIIRDVNLTSITVKKNKQTIINQDGGGWNEVKVKIPGGSGGNLDEKVITENGTYNASDDNLDGYSKLTVDIDPEIYASFFYESGYLERESPHETQKVAYGKGCTFSALPRIVDGSALDYAYPAISYNPKELTSGFVVTTHDEDIHRTEISDSWEYIAQHPTEYAVGMWKTLSFSYPNVEYGGNTYALGSLDLKMVKVGGFEKPLGFHNGYANSVWCSENVCGASIRFCADGGPSIADKVYGWTGSGGLRDVLEAMRTQIFPQTLAEAIKPVLNKSTYAYGKLGYDASYHMIFDGVTLNDAESRDYLWIPSKKENIRYMRAIKGNKPSSFDLNRFIPSSEGGVTYWLRDMQIDPFAKDAVLIFDAIEGKSQYDITYLYDEEDWINKYNPYSSLIGYAPNALYFPLCFCL